ncbi:MAG: hypothetical protein MUE60_14385, partial [Candidatus Eisenbacteria bacterium]|nr:hypothetical protein [Candidatus Eisenbacteria bacterium]
MTAHGEKMLPDSHLRAVPGSVSSRCTMTAGPGQHLLRGRVVAVNGDEVTVDTQDGLRSVAPCPAGGFRPADIVEILTSGDGRTALASGLLVRPSAPARRGLPEEDRTMPSVAAVLSARGAMITCIREFFLGRGFHEVPTPALVSSPGMEPHLAGFSTEYEDHTGARHRKWLPTSPEFALKRALCAGFERVFEVKTVFRNRGEMGPLHFPEFTILEWYRAFADYRVIMEDTEQLISLIARGLGAQTSRPFRGFRIDWDAPFRRMSVSQAYFDYAGIDLLSGMEDPAGFRAACETRLSRVPPDEDFASLFHRVMIELVEPRLGLDAPLILHDYPLPLAALAVAHRANPRLCERFELYVAGVELANAFTEVNDPRE